MSRRSLSHLQDGAEPRLSELTYTGKRYTASVLQRYRNSQRRVGYTSKWFTGTVDKGSSLYQF